jgi:hypothetical protein
MRGKRSSGEGCSLTAVSNRRDEGIIDDGVIALDERPMLGINKAIAVTELGLGAVAILRAVGRNESPQKEREHLYLAGRITPL